MLSLASRALSASRVTASTYFPPNDDGSRLTRAEIAQAMQFRATGSGLSARPPKWWAGRNSFAGGAG